LSRQEDSVSDSKSSCSSAKFIAPLQNITANAKNFTKAWNKENDQYLKKLVPKYKNDWKKISRKIFLEFGVKTTPNFLRNYFMKITADEPKCPKIQFNRRVDANIAYLVNKFGL